MNRFVFCAFAVALSSSCGPPERQDWENTFQGEGEDLFLLDDDLVCLGDERWEKVGKVRVWNPLGHQEVAVDHLKRAELGEYPIGTVISLLHDEVSVKRGKGFSPDTGDWEFITLAAGNDGESIITQRGTTEVKNIANTCIACHGGAAAFDFVCQNTLGCGTLPPVVDTDIDPDTDDPRCK